MKNWVIVGIISSLCLPIYSVWAKDYQLAGQNAIIKISDSNDQTSITSLDFINAKNNDLIKVNTLFEITLSSGKKLTDKDLRLENLKQKDNNITLTYSGENITIQTVFDLNDRNHFASFELQITPKSKPLSMTAISLMPFHSQAPFVYGSIVSSPIISDTFFIIPENPLTNTVAYEGGVTQKIPQAIP